MKIPELDRTVAAVFKREDDDEDVGYWLAQTSQARLAALEINRRVLYGYDDSERLQRVLEITRREIR
jgi:hypothetical protein